MRSLFLIIFIVILFPSLTFANEIEFTSLSKCNFFRSKELKRSIDYALKMDVAMKECYQIDDRKEYLVIAKTDTPEKIIGVYIDNTNKRLTVDDNIMSAISQWKTDNP